MKLTKGKADPATVERWWQEYITSGRKNEFLRNRLIERFLPIVKCLSERLHKALPEEVEIDDLISAGVLGLINAVKGFNPSQGAKFETYCAFRIKGAMLDELRSMDWVPRLVRARARKIHNAIKSFRFRNNDRDPTHGELAQHMQISIDELRQLKRDAHTIGIISLSRKWFSADSNKDVCEADVLVNKRAEDPTWVANRNLLKDLVIKGLSRAERYIIIMYYFEEMTSLEIGKILGLSESRISQMHNSILVRLRKRLEHRRTTLLG